MRVISIFLSLLFLAAVPLVPSMTAADGAPTRFRGILVAASNEAGQSDPRLAEFEPTLRRVLRFQSYRLVGQGTASVAVPGKGNISVGGHRLELETEASGGAGVRVRARWVEGGREHVNMVLVLQRNVPVVLGGMARSSSGEELGFILVAN